MCVIYIYIYLFIYICIYVYVLLLMLTYCIGNFEMQSLLSIAPRFSPTSRAPRAPDHFVTTPASSYLLPRRLNPSQNFKNNHPKPSKVQQKSSKTQKMNHTSATHFLNRSSSTSNPPRLEWWDHFKEGLPPIHQSLDASSNW